MRKTQLIFQIGTDKITSSCSKTLEIKWRIKSRSLDDHQIIPITATCDPKPKFAVNSNTKLIVLGHGDETKRDAYYKSETEKIITLDELAQKIVGVINKSSIGSFENPLHINLITCFGGYSDENSSLAENLHGALLKLGVHAGITARDSVIKLNDLGRKKRCVRQ